MFPIVFGTDLGEGEPIDVYRISADDATARQHDTLNNHEKLKGHVLGAFGAFLDKTWRENDILTISYGDAWMAQSVSSAYSCRDATRGQFNFAISLSTKLMKKLLLNS